MDRREARRKRTGKPAAPAPAHPIAASKRTGELRPREERVAQGVAAGKSISQAMREAGFHPTSRTVRDRLKPGGDIHARVVEILNQEGVTLVHAAKRLRESMDAEETKFFPTVAQLRKVCVCAACRTPWEADPKVVACPKCGGLDWAVREETYIPRETVIAHGHRLDAVDLAFKLHGAYPKEQDGPQGAGPVAVEVVVNPPAQQVAPVGIQIVTVQPGNGHGHNGNGTNGRRH